MDNRKKKQTLSRNAHRGDTQNSGMRSKYFAGGQIKAHRSGRSAHISQNRTPSPLTPDSLRSKSTFSGERGFTGGPLMEEGNIPASDFLTSEPYKPSSSYAEALVTDAELEAFLSNSVQSMIPDDDFSRGITGSKQETPAGTPENPYSFSTAHGQSVDTVSPDQTIDSIYDTTPVSPTVNQVRNSDSSVGTHTPSDTGRYSPGQDPVSSAGKDARNKTLSQIAAAVYEADSSDLPAESSDLPAENSNLPAESPAPLAAGSPAHFSGIPSQQAAPVKRTKGRKPEKILSVKNVVGFFLTLAGAAVCILIVHYFHMRSVGITPEIGIFSVLSDNALKSEEKKQEEQVPDPAAQTAPSQDTGASSFDGLNEADPAYNDPETPADDPDQSVSGQEETAGLDPASLSPASQDPVSPLPASQDPAYSAPDSQDPSYPSQEETVPVDSDEDYFEEEPEEEPEEETEWNYIEEDDPDWDDLSEPDEEMEEEDEEDEDYED